MKLLKNKRFIVFGEDFNRHPHALEHLLRPMFNDNSFLWVQTIGLRSPRFSLYDLKRILEKLGQWFLNAKKDGQNKIPPTIKIISPLMLPYSQFSLVRKLNQWSVKRAVNQALRELKGEELISIASVPNACDYAGEFRENLVIYFCVDDFALWPGIDQKLARKLEEKLLKRASLLIATSEQLCLDKKRNDRPVYKITHGVEFDHWDIGPKKTNGKKLCYFGLFDERSDQTLLAALADHLPDYEIHIIGEVICDVSALKKKKNIFFSGKISYQDLPQRVNEMDAFLLPYQINELTRRIHPLKLKEYMATGRPVYSTLLPEVQIFNDYVYLSVDAEDMIQKIKTTLHTHVDRASGMIRESETWPAKAEVLSRLIEKEVSASP